MSGKGSAPRPFSVSRDEYNDRFDQIFRRNRMTPKTKDNGEDFGTCGCGRSPTGKCIGWHGLSEDDYKIALEKYQTNQEDTDGTSV